MTFLALLCFVAVRELWEVAEVGSRVGLAVPEYASESLSVVAVAFA